jgi:hypothetical protein
MTSPWQSTIPDPEPEPASACQDRDCESTSDELSLGLFTLPSGHLMCAKCTLIYAAWLLDVQAGRDADPHVYDWLRSTPKGAG